MDDIAIPYAYGFVNFTGAACWLNSMVQAIMGCPNMNTISVNKDGKMLELYNTIIRQYSKSNNDKIFTLRDILLNLSNSSGIVQNINNQNDPTEFIQLFIEKMGKEANDKCMHTMKSTILCDDHKHETRDNGVLIPVALEHIGDLTSYLKRHSEKIMYRCERKNDDEGEGNVDNMRKESEEKIRLLQLSHGSEVLIVMVKNYLTSNFNRNIDYPDEIVFNKIGGGKWVYYVVSVVEHHGTKNMNHIIMSGGGSGHYTCTSIRKNNEGDIGIYNLNDSNATKVNNFPKTPNICIIVYARKSLD